jgi:hypothetical protein
MFDSYIHFWKCTEEGEFDKFELRKIDLTNENMLDEPVIGSDHHKVVPL